MEAMNDFTLKQWIIVVILVAVVTFGIGFIFGKNYGLQHALVETNKEPILTSQSSQEPTLMTIYVTGAVKNPDVYKLNEGSIIKDAINIAGGPLDNADLVSVNLARKIQDGEEIIVPFKVDNNITNESNNNGSTAKNGKININTASLSELESLPGIGEVKANAIINYRKSNGLFKDIKDIVNVSGIGEKTFDMIKDLICIN
jgi:competence protein ComEA